MLFAVRAEAVTPEAIEIEGWDADAMEPAISCDENNLYFNNRNDPAEQTDLYYATRVGENRFRFQGEIEGANVTEYLDAVPSVSDENLLYFISTRSFHDSGRTLYSLPLTQKEPKAIPVKGELQSAAPGWLIMDAEVSRDGQLLAVADAYFTGGKVPERSDLRLLRRSGEHFVTDPESDTLLREINTDALEFAPSFTTDKLTLFFTRLEGLSPKILAAKRGAIDQPFAQPAQLSEIKGFAEAPTVSCSGRSLYFHMLVEGRYRIFRLSLD